jgi:DNA-cytosine methyltransferase
MSNRPIRYGSVCSGIEAASVAWAPLGWTPAFFSEIANFPSRVLKHHYPSVPNHGDFTRISASECGPGDIDLLVGGTPCFPAEVLILTTRGLLPISEVAVGDEVLTHQNRFRKVLATGSKMAKTIRLKGQGVNELVTTREHPVYTRPLGRRWDNEARTYRRTFGNPEWTPAAETKGRFWASPVVFPSLHVPMIQLKGRESVEVVPGPNFWWVVGYWLGDGWTRIDERRGSVLLCSNKRDEKILAGRLTAAGLNFSVTQERTTARFQVSSRAFARWLKEQFGAGCNGKRVPSWLLGMPRANRKAFLEGYLYADGCQAENGHRLTSVNKGLIVGARLLLQSLGFSVSVTLNEVRRAECVIEGRRVSEQPFYVLSCYSRARSSFEEAGHRWGLVRKVEETGRTQQVFNLEVEEDNSYVADGIVVHNCQSFSIAGLRGGLADSRGNLALEFMRLADRTRPRWIVWENVPGVLSSNGGRDFGSILGALGELGYGFAYRVLDAQFFGVPQRRRRVFVVGCLGNQNAAAAVLLEREGLFRNPPSRRAKRRESSAESSEGTRGNGVQCVTGSVTHTLKAEGCDASEDGTGRGNPIVPHQRVAHSLTCHAAKGGDPTTDNYVVAFHPWQDPISGRVSPCLNRKLDGMGVMTQQAVRRLTPVECERLQSFPDGYTDIPGASDTARYRALGNSMNTSVMAWIGRRIDQVHRLLASSH